VQDPIARRAPPAEAMRKVIKKRGGGGRKARSGVSNFESGIESAFGPHSKIDSKLSFMAMGSGHSQVKRVYRPCRQIKQRNTETRSQVFAVVTPIQPRSTLVANVHVVLYHSFPGPFLLFVHIPAIEVSTWRILRWPSSHLVLRFVIGTSNLVAGNLVVSSRCARIPSESCLAC
jgi:hypothetical protein